MTSPLISILIPVYNVEAYLAECLRSIWPEVNSVVEIILVDDASTDNSMQCLRELAQDSPCSMQLLEHASNRGLSAARNTLAAAARGQYLWFLDSDDALVPGALTQLCQIITQHQPDYIICDYEIWRTTGIQTAKQRRKESHVKSFSGVDSCLEQNGEALLKGLFATGKLHCWSKVFQRRLWSPELAFPEGRYFEDMVFTSQLALSVNNYYYCPQVWVRYRQREQSILSTLNHKKIEDMVTALNGVFAQWLTRYPDLSSAARYTYIRYAIKIHFYALKSLKKLQGDNRVTLDNYRAILRKNIVVSPLGALKLCLLNGDVLRLPRVIKALY